jgi:hypothetical protein
MNILRRTVFLLTKIILGADFAQKLAGIVGSPPPVKVGSGSASANASRVEPISDENPDALSFVSTPFSV